MLERLGSKVHGSLVFLRLARPVIVAMGDAFDTADLAQCWDEVSSIRDKLRNNGNLVEVKKSGGDSSINECRDNVDVLTPLLHRFFLARLKLPDIQGLRHEITNVYKKAQRNPSESDVDDNAWDLRSMLRFIKRKANRDDPSTESCQFFDIYRSDFSNDLISICSVKFHSEVGQFKQRSQRSVHAP